MKVRLFRNKLLKLIKETFLEVSEESRELENEKNKPKPETNTKPTPKPKHLPFELMKRLLQNKLLKLIKETFLEVRERSRVLEMKKTKPKPETNTKPTPNQHPNQNTYLFN